MVLNVNGRLPRPDSSMSSDGVKHEAAMGCCREPLGLSLSNAFIVQRAATNSTRSTLERDARVPQNPSEHHTKVHEWHLAREIWKGVGINTVNY